MNDIYSTDFVRINLNKFIVVVTVEIELTLATSKVEKNLFIYNEK